MSFIVHANSKCHVLAHQRCLRSFKIIIKQWIIFPEITLIDRTSSYLEYIAITPKQMTTTHTPAYFFACLFSLFYHIVHSTWRMRSLRKYPEGGTRFETATLIGLIADQWQFSYIQLTMRLVFLSILTGGLAYRVCVTVMEAPPQYPRP